MLVTPEILERLQGVQRAGDGWLAFCPAHEDRKQRSLSISQTQERTLLHCFVGCAPEQIVRSAGTTLAALFTANTPATAAGSAAGNGTRPVLTLEAFAAAKGFPVDFLREHGVIEDARGLRITYRLADGSEAPRQRRRTALAAKDGSIWEGPRGESPVAYGLWRLDDAADLGEAWLLEGETCTLTAWLHNLPALGIPGADMTKLLTSDALRGLARVWVLEEPDRGGATFVAGCAKRLAELGFTGDARAVRLPVKDLNDLHRQAGDGFAHALARAQAEARPLAVTPAAPMAAFELLGEGLGVFLVRTFPDEAPLIEGLLTSDGNGWIAGEEKLGKTYFALEEGLALSLGQPVAGRFPVPERRRVLFIEEEDPPRRANVRLRALLRGRGLDPDDVFLGAELNEWFRIDVWSGFSLDSEAWIARLDATCATFRPAIVYLDVLRKLTVKDLNKADQAGALLATLDELRRRHGVLFRVLHHYRKSQGFRVSRGSQEMGGSFVLGAWGECSLFFEPIGRKHGGCRVDVQVKDGPPVPSFKLGFYAEGPAHAPSLVRLTAEEDAPDTSADDVLRQALAAAPKTDAAVGTAGVSVLTLSALLKRSDKTIRRALKRLVEAKLVVVCGAAAKGRDLYAVAE